MAETLRGAVRERATTRALVGWVVVVAALYALLGSSPLQLATSLATGAVVGAARLLAEVYDLRDEVETLALGMISLAGGAALVAVEGDNQSVGVAFLLVGAWTALDAGQVLRHRGLADPSKARDGRDVYRDYLARRVHEAVRDRRRTPRELREALDAEGEEVDRAVEELRERGVLRRVGGELRSVDDDERADRGTLARTRSAVRAGLHRLARPIAIEFESESSATGDVR
ncbi:hypothetical protein SAMN05216559_0721 [Halomicrobium zhouii]|uniref:Uncharacterized protein n=1 Tax=Halomicrobium zhouii TaxID=767519 RepID=A0A1I6KG04_9EURY|nr:hypothetical protein [Halomicrobium zhouii]SFR89978.1 hypothetical protein SAMN05216559_0721 [Halomicrobium zhouii]